MTHRLYLYCMLALSSIAISSTFVTTPAAQQAEECVICLENICNNTPLSALRCTHLFHTACINQALKTNSKCPICKTESGRELFPRAACSPRSEQVQKGEKDRELKIAESAPKLQIQEVDYPQQPYNIQTVYPSTPEEERQIQEALQRSMQDPSASPRTPSAPPLRQLFEQDLKELEQNQFERAIQLNQIELEKKQKEDADLKAALEESKRTAQPSQYPVSPPLAFPISRPQHNPAVAQSSSSSSSSSPAPAQGEVRPTPPAGAAQAGLQYQPLSAIQQARGQSSVATSVQQTPAGAAPQAAVQATPRQPAATAASVAPLSYSQQVLQAAWAKTQSWGTYFSERARAGWASFKALLNSLLG